MDDKIKKNLLDLHFQKHLMIVSTSTIILFTYAVGVGIALLTKQIELDSFFSMNLLAASSTVVFGACSVFLFKSFYHLKRIPREMKDLKSI